MVLTTDAYVPYSNVRSMTRRNRPKFRGAPNEPFRAGEPSKSYVQDLAVDSLEHTDKEVENLRDELTSKLVVPPVPQVAGAQPESALIDATQLPENDIAVPENNIANGTMLVFANILYIRLEDVWREVALVPI
jgi:hypothetical protein